MGYTMSKRPIDVSGRIGRRSKVRIIARSYGKKEGNRERIEVIDDFEPGFIMEDTAEKLVSMYNPYLDGAKKIKPGQGFIETEKNNIIDKHQLIELYNFLQVQLRNLEKKGKNLNEELTVLGDLENDTSPIGVAAKEVIVDNSEEMQKTIGEYNKNKEDYIKRLEKNQKALQLLLEEQQNSNNTMYSEQIDKFYESLLTMFKTDSSNEESIPSNTVMKLPRPAPIEESITSNTGIETGLAPLEETTQNGGSQQEHIEQRENGIKNLLEKEFEKNLFDHEFIINTHKKIRELYEIEIKLRDLVPKSERGEDTNEDDISELKKRRAELISEFNTNAVDYNKGMVTMTTEIENYKKSVNKIKEELEESLETTQQKNKNIEELNQIVKDLQQKKSEYDQEIGDFKKKHDENLSKEKLKSELQVIELTGNIKEIKQKMENLENNFNNDKIEWSKNNLKLKNQLNIKETDKKIIEKENEKNIGDLNEKIANSLSINEGKNKEKDKEINKLKKK